MDFVKVYLITNQASVDALLAENNDHWIEEAINEFDYTVDDLSDCVAPVYMSADDGGDVITMDATKLFAGAEIVQVEEVNILQYQAGSVFNDHPVPAFKRKDDPEHVYWIPYTQEMDDDGVL